MTRFTALLLAVPALGLAQYNYGSSTKGTKTTTAMAKSSPTADSDSSSVHEIAVGEGGLKYTPNSFTAKVGDKVEFNFVSSGHSVVEGVFNNPCQPNGASAFFSGFPKTGVSWDDCLSYNFGF
jgi:plastocyanin